LDGFMNHHQLSNCRRTTVSQKLLADLEQQRNEFLNFVQYRRIQHDYPLALIGNMDETPLSFDIPSNYTIDKTGTKTIEFVQQDMKSLTSQLYLVIENVWNKRSLLFVDPRSLLVLDSFLGHLTDEVKTTWDQVDFALIVRAFKCCGISVARDGSEEDKIFEYEWVKNLENQHKNSDYVFENLGETSN
ncbi:8869_t:CDS:2, partial [Scutellospora calospora]